MPTPALSSLSAAARRTSTGAPVAKALPRSNLGNTSFQPYSAPQTTQIAGQTYTPWRGPTQQTNTSIPEGALRGGSPSEWWIPLAGNRAPTYGYDPGRDPSYLAQVARQQAETDAQKRRISTSQLKQTWSELMPEPPPREPFPSEADDTAAMDAAFSRAKDITGKNVSAGMKTLQNELDARGVGGGGYETSRLTEEIGGGVGALGDLAREQAIQSLARKQKVADRNLDAGITQRGQDISIYQNRLPLLLQLLQAQEGVLY